MKIYARTTNQGTAASETAVCEDHLLLSPPGMDGQIDGPFSEPIDCSGNDMLECVECGATSDA